MRAFGTVISGNRRKNDELSPHTRSAIMSALANETSPSKIAADHNVSRQTVYNTRKRFESLETFDSRPRKGGPVKFSAYTKRYIYRIARRHPAWSYKALIANTPGGPSRTTIRRILYRYGLRKWKSKERIPLTREDTRERRHFCRDWAGFTEWEKVMFSDESSV
jgi:transposase